MFWCASQQISQFCCWQNNQPTFPGKIHTRRKCYQTSQRLLTFPRRPCFSYWPPHHLINTTPPTSCPPFLAQISHFPAFSSALTSHKPSKRKADWVSHHPKHYIIIRQAASILPRIDRVTHEVEYCNCTLIIKPLHSKKIVRSLINIAVKNLTIFSILNHISYYNGHISALPLKPGQLSFFPLLSWNSSSLTVHLKYCQECCADWQMIKANILQSGFEYVQLQYCNQRNVQAFNEVWQISYKMLLYQCFATSLEADLWKLCYKT